MKLQHLKPGRDKNAPMYKQLYSRYREAIYTGKLRPGDRVPSVRSLASELNVARGTVEAAYQMLVSEGFFVTYGAAGTKVAPLLGSETLRPAPPPKLPDDNGLSAPEQASVNAMPFQLGLPALDAFPRKTWTRLAARNLRQLEMTAPDPAGLLNLRCAIAKYVSISRGIACSCDQVFVTVGYRGALDLICRTLLRSGDVGWFEDPGYFHARQSLEWAGMHLHPVAVDDEGMDVAEGEREASDARFALVTPAHQSPMGSTMSLPRRLALLAWAQRNQAWIIEDDYDSEFRYYGRPFQPIKSLDRDGRVLYTGTFSKVLFAGVRLAYLIVPNSQVELFRTRVAQLPGAGNVLPQATVAEFMQQGHFARHLNRMRRLYAKRHDYLVEALSQRLGDRLKVQHQAGGLHILAYLQSTQEDRRVAAAAQADGLALSALSDWRIQPARANGLIMGFANFATQEQAQSAVERLAEIWPDIN